MEIIKRDGRRVAYDGSRIVLAIQKAMADIGEIDSDIVDDIEDDIMSKVASTDEFWSVEEISDEVEKQLMEHKLFNVAKTYILYRNRKKGERKLKKEFVYLSDNFLTKYKHRKSPFPNQLGEFVYYRTYSRYLEEFNRREYWWETVARAVDYNVSLVKYESNQVAIQEAENLYDNMFNLKQFLSGRTMFTGGTEASKLYGMSNYNCSFTIIDDFTAYKDMFYLLMIGSGVGFRVLREDVHKLPKLRTDIDVIHKTYVAKPKHKRQEYTSLIFTGSVAELLIGDSKEAWTDALYKYFELHFDRKYKGVKNIIINYNDIRPKGERLKIFGGYSSGYESMLKMLTKIDMIIKSNRALLYKKLTPLECSDISNIIGENVVSGGVRRTSEICLFDSDNDEIKYCKSNLFKPNENGIWEIDESISHRRMSDNSIQYWEKPTRDEWHNHVETMKVSGEPAFQNMVAAKLRREDAQGGNPCMEIILRKMGVCNLTEVNVMGFVEENVLNIRELIEAQRMSARAGYRMASIDFELYNWDIVNKEDMLIGCSLTGWQDMKNATDMSLEDEISLMKLLKDVAIEESDKMSIRLGMNKSKLHTTIKPSGTLSQLPTVSNGCHWSHSPYYIRRVRISAIDPLSKVARDLGWNWNPEVGQTVENMDTIVVDFYVKSPEGTTKYDITAIEQLEQYKLFMTHYANHNVSITVHVRDHEWKEVEDWCYENWDVLVAVSFLSLDNSFYQLMPYESITKEQYEEAILKQNKFNPELLLNYETREDSDLDESECADGHCPTR